MLLHIHPAVYVRTMILSDVGKMLSLQPKHHIRILKISVRTLIKYYSNLRLHKRTWADRLILELYFRILINKYG